MGETAISGTNDVRIEAQDVAGNVTTIGFQIIVEEDPIPAGSDDLASSDVGNGPAVLISAEPAMGGVALQLSDAPHAPVLYPRMSGGDPLAVVASTENGWLGWVPAGLLADTIWLDTESGREPLSLNWQAVSFLDGGIVTADDGRATVSFTPGDLYYSSYFQFTSEPAPAKASAVVSRLYALEPTDLPFARAGRLSVSVDNPSPRAGIYRYRRDRNTWSYITTERNPSTGTLSGDIDYPGAFAVLVDDDPPTIRKVRPARGSKIANRRPVIRFEMFDDLSGIGSDADVVLTIDGEWVPVEYDVDTRNAKAQPREPLSLGEHRVEIAVTDQAGNEETYLRILRIVP